jgi:endonuclease/exonuclease/phosphatase family metal-dependent hydrolase
MKLKFATFNCENLFSRARILNFENDNTARPDLVKLAKLNALIAKPNYSAADKAAMLKLIKTDLKGFIDLSEMRGKLVSRSQGKDIIKPSGRNDWTGGIVLTRDKLPTLAQENTARVVNAIDADVQAVVEVEDRTTLEDFGKLDIIQNPFAWNMLIDGNDTRGIDVGLLSKLPIVNVITHIFDKTLQGERIFSRDCLQLELKLSDGRPLHVLINHFKSQGYGSPASNNAKRKLQADRVIEILQDFNLATELVVVCGDFNDKPDSAPLTALLQVSNLTDVLTTLPAGEPTWTYKDKKQIDYLLVSRPLLQGITNAGVERRGMTNAEKLTGGATKRFPEITSEATDASDHAAVWAEFNI